MVVTTLRLCVLTLRASPANLAYLSPSKQVRSLAIDTTHLKKRTLTGTYKGSLNFTYGVASGDPEPNSVMWVRPGERQAWGTSLKGIEQPLDPPCAQLEYDSASLPQLCGLLRRGHVHPRHSRSGVDVIRGRLLGQGRSIRLAALEGILLPVSLGGQRR